MALARPEFGMRKRQRQQGGVARRAVRQFLLGPGLEARALFLEIALQPGGIALLGQAAIPLVLIQLGVQMGASGRIQRTPPVITAVALRAVAVPLLAAGTGLLVGLDGVGLASLVLAAAMPIAVNTLMLAREYGADSDTVASSVVASTFLSIPILVVLISALPALTG